MHRCWKNIMHRDKIRGDLGWVKKCLYRSVRRVRKVFSGCLFEGREWTLEVRFLERVGRLCIGYMEVIGRFLEPFWRGEQGWKGREARLQECPTLDIRTPDYILYLDPVLEPVLFLFIFYCSMNRLCSSLPSFNIFCAYVKLIYICVHGFFFFWLNFFDWIPRSFSFVRIGNSHRRVKILIQDWKSSEFNFFSFSR